MKLYWKKLKSHPGIPTASVMTVAFALAGLANEKSPVVGLIAALMFSTVMWGIVLWTARKVKI